ncbi:MAG: acyltransferase [Planctomycetales bacterium]|nr:acyltransferase [Planctomycetales bacterium]
MLLLEKSANDPYETFLSVKHFGSLDGLRCFSIFAVLWHHSGIHIDFPLFQRGQLGVHLFFAISGFLITTLMLRERIRHGDISLPKFYMRRSLRIFPMYYAVLLTYAVAVFVLERGSDAGIEFFGNLPAFVTYTSNWFVDPNSGERVIFYFAWSLAVEEQFYLTWPWLERYLQPKVTLLLLLTLIGIVLANHLGLLLWLIPTGSLAHRILWAIAPCILLGVLVAHVVHSKKGFSLLYALFGHALSSPVMLLIVIAVSSVPRFGMAGEYLVYLSLVFLVTSCTIREDNGLARLLQLKPLVRFGIVSYGIYLMHMLCFNTTNLASNTVKSPFLRWILGIIFVYLVAEFSFHTFERWFLNLKSRFSR